MSSMEMWFTLGALVMTLVAGLFLVPALRAALSESEPRDGGEGTKPPTSSPAGSGDSS